MPTAQLELFAVAATSPAHLVPKNKDFLKVNNCNQANENYHVCCYQSNRILVSDRCHFG